MKNKSYIPDISVIIPCYNQGKFLESALRSINEVTSDHLNLETIIINDGSTDQQTIEILNSELALSCRIIHQPNKGLSGARNTGLRNARGKYVQFLDADDILTNDKFIRQLQIFEQDHDLAVVVSSFLCSTEDINKTYRDLGALTYTENDYPLEDFLFRWERGFTVPIHCALFKRELCFIEDKNFDETLSSKEDWFFWCKLAFRKLKFRFHDDVMAIYRVYSSSMCRDVTKSMIGYIAAQAKISNYIEDWGLRDKFIKKSAEHIENVYLLMYRQEILTTWLSQEGNRRFSSKVWQSIKGKLKQVPGVKLGYSLFKQYKNRYAA